MSYVGNDDVCYRVEVVVGVSVCVCVRRELVSWPLRERCFCAFAAVE
jgi:hypothetical protein